MKYLIVVLLVVVSTGLFATFEDLDQSWYSGDKIMHGYLSFGITVVAFDSIHGSKLRVNPYLTAVGISLTLGIGKEIVDHNLRGMPLDSCLKDVAWDMAGISLGLFVSYLMDKFEVTGKMSYDEYRLRGANVIDLRGTNETK